MKGNNHSQDILKVESFRLLNQKKAKKLAACGLQLPAFKLWIFSCVILTPFISFNGLQAQELNCDVVINTPKLQLTEPGLFKTMQTSIMEFMNNRKWTGDVFQNRERIKCKIIITITNELSINKFKAQAIIQSNRPVFNSDYETVLFNYADDQWEIEYTEFQPLEYNENAHLSNLTSMLAYYAYILIGMDYDSFSEKGGTPYFLKAQSIVNNAQNVREEGWKPYEKNRNRYWMVENFLNNKFTLVRSNFYQYHIKGLDRMYENRNAATTVITNGLATLDQVNRDNPNSMIIPLFFSAKNEELVSLFKGSSPADKMKSVNLLVKLDAGNSQKYQGIMK